MGPYRILELSITTVTRAPLLLESQERSYGLVAIVK